MDKKGYNIVIVVVDYLGKHYISIPCHKTIDAKETAYLYIHYVYYIYRLLDTIVSNYRLQFILAF